MKKGSLGTVLNQTLGTALAGYETVSIGSKINVKMEGGRHVTIGFYSGVYADRWTEIELRLVSNDRGLLETQNIPFNEVFDSMVDPTHPNRIEKYVWNYQGDHSWYGKPTPKELKSLRAQIKDYLNLVE